MQANGGLEREKSKFRGSVNIDLILEPIMGNIFSLKLYIHSGQVKAIVVVDFHTVDIPHSWERLKLN